jgi:hypothetical protein
MVEDERGGRLKSTQTEIQVAITDELKKFQKEEFSAAFQKLYNRAEACIYISMELILNKKMLCVFLMCLQFLEKSVLILLDRTVYTTLGIFYLFKICYINHNTSQFL